MQRPCSIGEAVARSRGIFLPEWTGPGCGIAWSSPLAHEPNSLFSQGVEVSESKAQKIQVYPFSGISCDHWPLLFCLKKRR